MFHNILIIETVLNINLKQKKIDNTNDHLALAFLVRNSLRSTDIFFSTIAEVFRPLLDIFILHRYRN